MFGIGMPELILILIVALVVFGPGKLPEVGRALGKTIKEFKKVASSISIEQPAPKNKSTNSTNASASEDASTKASKPENGASV